MFLGKRKPTNGIREYTLITIILDQSRQDYEHYKQRAANASSSCQSKKFTMRQPWLSYYAAQGVDVVDVLYNLQRRVWRVF